MNCIGMLLQWFISITLIRMIDLTNSYNLPLLFSSSNGIIIFLRVNLLPTYDMTNYSLVSSNVLNGKDMAYWAPKRLAHEYQYL